MSRKKENNKNNIKLRPIILVSIIIITVLIVVVGMYTYQRKKDNIVIPKVDAIIMYSINNQAKEVLEDNSTLTAEPTISWPKYCTGIIKKAGKVISEENDTLLVENGTYEITVISSDKKDKTKRRVTVDNMPPEVIIANSSSNTYTISFKEPKDVEKAMLTKYDIETDKLLEEVNLKEQELLKGYDVKSVGYYILEYSDKAGNANVKDFVIEK